MSSWNRKLASFLLLPRLFILSVLFETLLIACAVSPVTIFHEYNVTPLHVVGKGLQEMDHVRPVIGRWAPTTISRMSWHAADAATWLVGAPLTSSVTSVDDMTLAGDIMPRWIRHLLVSRWTWTETVNYDSPRRPTSNCSIMKIFSSPEIVDRMSCKRKGTFNFILAKVHKLYGYH